MGWIGHPHPIITTITTTQNPIGHQKWKRPTVSRSFHGPEIRLVKKIPPMKIFVPYFGGRPGQLVGDIPANRI